MVEEDERARLVGVLLDCSVRDLADEAERSFRADHQVRQHVDRVAEVDQRIEAVAGRVLQPELVADPRGELGVGAGLASEFGEAFDEIRARPREFGAARRVARVEHRAVGEDDADSGQRVVAVLRRPAAHSARVVGGDAADHRCVDRRRIGADLPAERCERTIRGGADHSGLQRDRRAVGSDPHAAPAVAEHDEHRVGDRLARQARSRGAERRRRAEARAAREDAPKLVLVLDDDDELGNEAVEARVAAPREEPQRVGDEAVFGDEDGELVPQLAMSVGRHGASSRSRDRAL
jgi:hypothetical protein